MLVKINNEICSVKYTRLTKKNKSEIIEKLIDKKENINLSQICDLRNSEVERINTKEIEELERFDPDYNFVTKL
jgi:hypothetical protein